MERPMALALHSSSVDTEIGETETVSSNRVGQCQLIEGKR